MNESQNQKSQLEVKLGNFSFSASGGEAWLSEQFARVLDTVDFSKVSLDDGEDSLGSSGDGTGDGEISAPPLPVFLKDKGADKSQNRKFLVTAGWLTKRGRKNLTTSMVTAALKENQQRRLSNASQALAENIQQGHCEKTGKEFFITQEGWSSIGE